MRRREFVKAGTLGLLSLAAQPWAFAGDQPQKYRIGMAATTWLTASPSTASFWQAASALSALNIGATEADNGEARLDTAYHKNVAEFLARSRKLGVYLPGVFQALPVHESGKLPQMRSKTSSVAAFLKAAGAEYIALGWDVPWTRGSAPYKRTPDDLKRAISNMDEIGRLSSQQYGIKVAFHAERDVPKEMVLEILDKTNPQFVHLCADVGHLTAMGLDPVKVVADYSSRLAVSHWKDFSPHLPGPAYLGPASRGDFTEVGQGVVNFRALADLYRKIGFAGWVMIELDRTREPSIVGSARQMRSFVANHLGLKIYPARR